MTIDELLALTGLTGSDEIPVWDAEASGEPTKKITAQNFAAAVKTLASLLGTGDVVNDLTSTATDKPLSANMGKTLYTWTEVTLGAPSSGTIVSGSKLMLNNALQLAWLNIQVNGASADTVIALNCNVKNAMEKPIYGYNGYNNVPVNCAITAENKLVIKEASALVRVYAIFPASLT